MSKCCIEDVASQTHALKGHSPATHKRHTAKGENMSGKDVLRLAYSSYLTRASPFNKNLMSVVASTSAVE